MNLFEAMKQGKPIDWTLYKVCAGCESILYRETYLCPACHSYRSESDPGKVEIQAHVLLDRTLRGDERIPKYDF
ncbi:MAG: hypothetical protein ACO3PR_00035 [Limisphaerales bacterium]